MRRASPLGLRMLRWASRMQRAPSEVVGLTMRQRTVAIVHVAARSCTRAASLAASFYLGQIPHNVIEVTTSLTLLLIIFARVAQIMQSYTNKSTGQLSGLSQFMQVAGGCARLFTGMTEGASAAVLAGNVIGTSLNIAIMSQIIMYRGSDDDKPKKKL